MAKDTARRLAEEYVRLHNLASVDFTRLFNSIGARMWNMDQAHPLRERNVRFIARQMRDYLRRGHPEYIGQVYGHAIQHPLTVLDSYPKARRHLHKIVLGIRAVYVGYNYMWWDFLEKHGITVKKRFRA